MDLFEVELGILGDQSLKPLRAERDDERVGQIVLAGALAPRVPRPKW